MGIKERILYEDNHILIINKLSGELVQGDKTGDESLLEVLKAYIKERDKKEGNVFLGLCHRIDRPTSGIVIYAKTSKSLSRLSLMFQKGEVHKTYLALVDNLVDGSENGDEVTLEDYIYRNSKLNKSFVVDKSHEGAKSAKMTVRLIKRTKTYFLYSIKLFTGRHHQIRAQLQKRGVHIKGDLKYGAKRSNEDGSICLCSSKVEFIHPVSKKPIVVECTPDWYTDVRL